MSITCQPLHSENHGFVQSMAGFLHNWPVVSRKSLRSVPWKQQLRYDTEIECVPRRTESTSLCSTEHYRYIYRYIYHYIFPTHLPLHRPLHLPLRLVPLHLQLHFSDAFAVTPGVHLQFSEAFLTVVELLYLTQELTLRKNGHLTLLQDEQPIPWPRPVRKNSSTVKPRVR